ncbi:MAG TPA: hypothetical protein VGL39_22495 [Jatrophihabitantaceae bacterium]
MQQLKKLLMIGGIAAAAVGVMAGQALANPPSGTTPGHTDVVGVGSDTTQGVVNQFSTDYNTSHTPKLYSFDATGGGNITPKADCTAIARPNGSGGGISALSQNARPAGDATDFCVDYARSSRGFQTGDAAGLIWVAYGEDAVTWSASSTTNAPATLTPAQLKAIYSCNDSALGGSGNPVTWNEVGGTGTAAVVPVIPQSSSGTRSFFLGQIGNPTLGSCVLGQDNSVEENEGTNAVFTGANSANVVSPYSVAVYLAQTEHGHGAGDQGSLTLHNVNGNSPTAGTAPNATINPDFDFVRLVYNVLRGTGSDPANLTVPSYLQGIFGSGAGTGWLCTDATAQADLSSFGFLSLADNCGTIFQEGDF